MQNNDIIDIWREVTKCNLRGIQIQSLLFIQD